MAPPLGPARTNHRHNPSPRNTSAHDTPSITSRRMSSERDATSRSNEDPRCFCMCRLSGTLQSPDARWTATIAYVRSAAVSVQQSSGIVIPPSFQCTIEATPACSTWPASAPSAPAATTLARKSMTWLQGSWLVRKIEDMCLKQGGIAPTFKLALDGTTSTPFTLCSQH